MPYFPWFIDYVDGSANLLRLYGGNPQDYLEWISSDGETSPDLAALTEVYAHIPLTPALLERLNPTAKLEAIAEDLQELGYPYID